MNTKYMKEPEGDFYERVKNTLSCNMDDWSEAQLRAEYSDATYRQNTSFYLEMIQSVAKRKGVEL
tara:strand:+ start:45 stop:239 length:195 start_codon:yes stop_codon:yes gene_type:complete